MTEPKVIIKANSIPLFFIIYHTLFFVFFFESTNCEHGTELSQMEGLSFALVVQLGTLPYPIKIFRPRNSFSLERTVYLSEYSVYSKTFWKSRLPCKKKEIPHQGENCIKCLQCNFPLGRQGTMMMPCTSSAFFFTKYIHVYYIVAINKV